MGWGKTLRGDLCFVALACIFDMRADTGIDPIKATLRIAQSDRLCRRDTVRLGEHPDHIASSYRRLPQACQSFEKAPEKIVFYFVISPEFLDFLRKIKVN